LRFTLPKAIAVAFTVSVAVAVPSCSAKVFDTVPADAVSVTVVAVLTALTIAENVALAEPAATVTELGTVTAPLLLPRFVINPPVAAAAFSVTVQLSVPAPVIEPLEQVRPVSTGIPIPLRLTTADVPVEELLVSVSVPEAAPAVDGSNCTVRVAV
jgi:hypothetical protein